MNIKQKKSKLEYQRKWRHAQTLERQRERLAHRRAMYAPTRKSAQKKSIYEKEKRKNRTPHEKASGRRKEITRRLKRLYGMTLEEKENLLVSQGYRCAICSMVLPSTDLAHCDHCHKTHKTRGLLCGHCNRGLGHFHDSLALLRNAQQYLLDKG